MEERPAGQIPPDPMAHPPAGSAPDFRDGFFVVPSPPSLGGSDEVSGYVMAAVASWGLACALVERAHVRIDMLRQRLAPPAQAAMDLFAMIVTNGVVLLIAWHCWPVLQKTLERGSRANTPLETPLWIPQGIWFSGWLWFALTATALSLIGVFHLAARRRQEFDAAIGMGSELDE